MNSTDKNLPDLGLRASMILKLVVERYLLEGQTVGSKTLAELPGMRLSPATIRSVLADLERMNLLASPHTSAGRMPTPDGMRVFLSRILLPSPFDAQGEMVLRRQLQQQLEQGQEPGRGAARTLAQLSQLAAVVSLPRARNRVLRQLEFMSLSARRVLAVLVFEPGEVQNRIFELQGDVSVADLQFAARQVNERFAGLSLDTIHRRLASEVRQSRQQVNEMLSRLAGVMADFAAQDSKLRVAGDHQLLAFDELTRPEKLRGLFAAFDDKQQLLGLLESCMQAEDMRIFLGSDSGLEALEGCGLITVPYEINGQAVGVVGVVGPMRMNYASLIPLVQATAKALGEHLNPPEMTPV